METVRQCAYKYDLPCAADADCGGGFTCEVFPGFGGGGCNDNPGGDPNDGLDDAGEPEQPTCESQPSGHCNLVQTVCTDDADCADGLACSAGPNGSGYCNPKRLGQQNGPNGSPNGNGNGGGGSGGMFGPNGGQFGDGGMGFNNGGDDGGDDKPFKLCSVVSPGARAESPVIELMLLGMLGCVVWRRRATRR
jgi:hypothetical protein